MPLPGADIEGTCASEYEPMLQAMIDCRGAGDRRRQWRRGRGGGEPGAGRDVVIAAESAYFSRLSPRSA
jgi:hypothetical protein